MCYLASIKTCTRKFSVEVEFLQDKERKKIENEMGSALAETEKKFSLMRDVLESDAPTPKPRTFKTPATTTKTRTYTTPGMIQVC